MSGRGRVYYNEYDPFATAWLEQLQLAGELPVGRIDIRSIVDVQPADIGDGDAHFFAGIGGWPLAMRLAGWPNDTSLWTGSCPCQPFSVAGKRRGTDDARHLWPDFFRLIRERRPPVVVGEQVASKDGRAWLAGVFADLESVGYAVAGADLCAAGVGSPHIRQRLYWCAIRVSDDPGERCDGGSAGAERQTWQLPRPAPRRATLGLADASGASGPEHERESRSDAQREAPKTDGAVDRRNCGPDISGGTLLALGKGLEGHPWHGDDRQESGRLYSVAPGSATTASNTGWPDSWWHLYRDGKSRRVPPEPCLFPLVDARALRNQVGTLRGSGNAIVPQLAAQFLESVMSYLGRA